jgi:hypothetical protein
LRKWVDAVGIGFARPGKASAAVGIFIGFRLKENIEAPPLGGQRSYA